MNIKCPILEAGNFLPVKYTCDGDQINPPLRISGVPQETKALALIMDDPDAPGGTFTHWLVWNLKPDTTQIRENEQSLAAVEGINSAGKEGYAAPCPPSGTHRYRFKIYALDSKLDLPRSIKQQRLESEIEDHLLDSDELVTKYERQQ